MRYPDVSPTTAAELNSFVLQVHLHERRFRTRSASKYLIKSKNAKRHGKLYGI